MCLMSECFISFLLDDFAMKARPDFGFCFSSAAQDYGNFGSPINKFPVEKKSLWQRKYNFRRSNFVPGKKVLFYVRQI